MLTQLTFDEARERVAPLVADWCDQVAPARWPSPPTHAYTRAYGWMDAYERELRRRIEAALGGRPHGLERRLFGPGTPLSEGLSNAFAHGHAHDPERPLEVRVAVGRRGLCFAVHDQGPGFDVTATLDRLQRGRGYFRLAGNGLRSLRERRDVLAGFCDGGRTLVLLFPIPA